MARERQITATLSLKAWEAFQKRRAEVMRRLEGQGLTTRSADSIAISELIEEGAARVSGSGDAPALPPAQMTDELEGFD